MSNEELFLIFFFVLLLAFLVLILLVLHQNRLFAKLSQHNDYFKLSQANELDRLKEKLTNDYDDQKKITSAALEKIDHQVGYLLRSQEELREIADDIVSLEKILNDKKLRGVFGEIELYHLLEMVYGQDQNFYARQYRLSNSLIADCVIKIDRELLVIDSKFPLENYRRFNDEDLDKNQRAKAWKDFKNDIFKHLKDIKNKYVISGETLDFALMFIPSYTICDEIYTKFDDLVEFSYRLGVYIVSPTSLLAFLTSFKKTRIHLEQEQNAKQILTQLEYLAHEFNRYEERFLKLKQEFTHLERAFEELDITGKKLAKRFRQIERGDLINEKV